MIEIVLVQRNLVDNEYRQKYEVLCTFTSNKSYGCLLKVEPNKPVILKI